MSTRRTLIIVAVALALLFASQALSAAALPLRASRADTGRVTGRAAFAYLGGLRKFAASVLWNRLEPQFHEYYGGGGSIANHAYMVPTLAAVQMLDPQFVQAYYISSYIVAKREGNEAGIAIARQGVANNPRSGLLRANLAQLLYLEDREANKKELAQQAKAALGDDTYWRDDDELFEGLAVFRDVTRSLGEEQTAVTLEHRLEQLRAQGAGAGDHDHDGDGKQDH